MSASQNKKKTLSLGLALIPVISMLLLLIIGYGIMGLRIEPLLLCSAAVAAGIDPDLRGRFDWHLDV